MTWGLGVVASLLATTAFAGAMVTGPAPPHEPWRGYEIGPWVSASMPTGRAEEGFDRGFSTGVSATALQTASVGMGLDVAYGHWPSPVAGALFDAFFSAFGGAPVTGTKFTMSEWRAALHLKFSPLRAERAAPWARVAVGASRTDQRLEVPVAAMQAAGWQVKDPVVDVIRYQPMAGTGLGVDFRTGARVKFGIHASYQWLFLAEESDPFTAFTLGAHMMFGRW